MCGPEADAFRTPVDVLDDEATPIDDVHVLLPATDHPHVVVTLGGQSTAHEGSHGPSSDHSDHLPRSISQSRSRLISEPSFAMFFPNGSCDTMGCGAAAVFPPNCSSAQSLAILVFAAV